MQAIIITRPGSPEVLHLREVAQPDCGPDEVRVAVRAAGLNRADLLQRRGYYPAPPGTVQDIPGLEFAGEVVARGQRVTGLEVGDRVMGILGGGGYAEQVCLHERLCVPIPERLSWEEAAAVPEVFFTAYDALYPQGGLGPGSSLLVHAAASGVGTAAVQLALAGGANVIALSRTADKRRRLEDLGLQHVFDPASEDLAGAIRRAAGGHGVDLVLDLVGASALLLNLDVLREGGCLIVVGLLGGARVELDLSLLLRKRLRLVGTALRSRPLEEKISLTQQWVRSVLPLIESGKVRPIIDRSFPLDRAAEAHAYMETNANFGKIVLSLE
jgi:putative PIG3 family NAD(P)H quinone oxidoreductase